MDPFRENAFYLLVWRAFLVALIAVVVMATGGFAFGAALIVGALVALLFSLGLVIWANLLSDERIVNTKAWRMLASNQRPAGAAGRRWARNYLKDIGLRFAQAASVAAIALLASALVLVSD